MRRGDLVAHGKRTLRDCFAWLLLAMTVSGAAAAERELRVCADPDNLPYSSEDRTGFENRIAAVVADELHAKLVYTWFPDRRGFVRKTLNAQACDVIVGVPADFERVRPTQPYYRSTFVFVYRRDGPRFESFDDPRLKEAKIGVQLVGNDLAATPPGHALVSRGLVDNVIGFVPFGERPQAERMVEAVARGDLDVALLWGPAAGFYVARESVPLVIAPARAPSGIKLPFEFSIAMGVRKRDAALEQALDEAITRRGAEIDAILREYGVPLVPLAIAKETRR